MFKKIIAHRLTRNTGALALLQVVSYIPPLLVLAHLTRSFGLELYGILAFSIAVTQYVQMLLDFGFSLSATHKISIWRERKGYVSRLISAIFAIKAVALVIAACAIMLYVSHSEKYHQHLDLFLLSLLSLAAQCFLPVWFFIGIEQMFYITIFTIVSKLLYLLLIFTLVGSAQDLLWVPVADGISQITGTAIAIYLLHRVGYFISLPRFRDIRYAAKLTQGFFISRFAIALYSSGGVLLLGLFGTPAATAIYALAERFYQATQQIFSPIVQAIFPYMAKEQDIVLLMKVAVGCITLAIAAALMLVGAGPYVISWWLGPSWSASAEILSVFALAIVIEVFISMSGYPLSSILKTMATANSSIVFGAAFYICIAGLLVATGHVTPLALVWTLVLTELLVLVYRAVVLWPKAYRLVRQGRPT